MDDLIPLLRAVRAARDNLRHTPHQRLRVGRIRQDAGGQVCGYRSGDVVIFEPYEDCRRCTIEKPMTPEQIEEQRAKGSRLTTYGTTVGVPAAYVEDLSDLLAELGGGDAR